MKSWPLQAPRACMQGHCQPPRPDGLFSLKMLASLAATQHRHSDICEMKGLVFLALRLYNRPYMFYLNI